MTWSRLLESELPASVADLADSRVRLLMGLAYARAAADEGMRGDPRQAIIRPTGGGLEMT